MHFTPSEPGPSHDEQQSHNPMQAEMPRMTGALILLCACVAILMTGFGIIVPVFPQRLQALGLGAETMAIMEGAFGLGMFLFSTPLGTLANRIGRKPIVQLSLIGFVVTNLILAFADRPAIFISIRFIEGALIAGVMPAAATIIGDSVAADKQGRWLGTLTTAQALGFAVGPGIGGLIYQAWGFSAPFLSCAITALVASLLALVLLPETLPTHLKEQNRLRKTTRGQHKELGKIDIGSITEIVWFFAPMILIDFGLAFIYPFVWPQYPFFFDKVLHFNSAQYGMIISVNGLALAVFPMILGPLSEFVSKKWLIIIGSLGFPALNVAMLNLQHYEHFLIAAVITGLGTALIYPALGTVYLAATNEENRSQVMGIRSSAYSLAVLIAPLTQAAIGNLIGPQITFMIGIASSLLVTLVVCTLLKTTVKEEVLVQGA